MKVIVATNHKNGEIRLWTMQAEAWMESIFQDLIKSKLQNYIQNKIGDPSQSMDVSPILDFKFVLDDGYPHVANKDSL